MLKMSQYTSEDSGYYGGRVWALDLGSGICAAHQIFVDRSWIFTLGIQGNSNFLSF